MKKLIYIISLFLSVQAIAQDTYFSQFTASPLNLNPALAGNSSCDWRVALNVRNEWINVSNSNTFLTGSLAGDIAIGKIKNKKANFGGVGILFNGSKMGSLNMMRTELMGIGAYHFVLGRAGKSTLSFGLEFGMEILNLDGSKAILASDIDPLTGIATPKGINTFSAVIPDASIGVMYSSKPSKNINFYLGSAFFHLPQAEYTSLLGNIDNRKHFRYSLQGGMTADIKQVSIMPSGIWMYQNGSMFYSIGSYFKYKLTNERKSTDIPMSIYLGGWYRNIKAITTSVRFDYGNFNFALSYDFNMSDITKVNGMAGAPELSIVYTGCFRRNTNKFGCPVVF